MMVYLYLYRPTVLPNIPTNSTHLVYVFLISVDRTEIKHADRSGVWYILLKECGRKAEEMVIWGWTLELEWPTGAIKLTVWVYWDHSSVTLNELLKKMRIQGEKGPHICRSLKLNHVGVLQSFKLRGVNQLKKGFKQRDLRWNDLHTILKSQIKLAPSYSLLIQMQTDTQVHSLVRDRTSKT